VIDPAEFQEIAKAFRDMMLAALLQERMIGYDGKIAGVDCVVVGYVRDPANVTAEIVPLAIVITDEVFEILEVDATKVGP